ncbi:hypothetical protein SDC9_56561 [bioreactor metagenome]|uniref:Uncharacterized protein n=1 Tax=bioreactor metagenome TaxID=1076179 RepID=A0A644X7H3_9ZZZZ
MNSVEMAESVIISILKPVKNTLTVSKFRFVVKNAVVTAPAIEAEVFRKTMKLRFSPAVLLRAPANGNDSEANNKQGYR